MFVRPLMRLSLIKSRPALVGIFLMTLTATACGSSAPGSPSASATPTLTVVATTTVLADLARNVTGPDATVESLVPKGGEVHTFDPTPGDVAMVADADLIVINGLGLDDWLGRTVTAASADRTPVVRLGEGLDGVQYIGSDEAGGGTNPHVWMNVAYAERYVTKLAQALESVAPARAAAFDANARAYGTRLAALDAWAKSRIGSLSPASRRIVSFHDAFPYLAAAYGLEIVGVAVEAPGQDPSAAHIAQLIDAIRTAHVKAVFSEAQFPPALVQQIAAETGTRVQADLYDDSLGDPPVDTYEGMIRWDVDHIVTALQ